MNRELRCDFGAEWTPEELRPGTLLLVVHTDGRNRQLHMKPAGSVGGFHVVGASHSFAFLTDDQVTHADRDFAVDQNGTAHRVLQRYGE